MICPLKLSACLSRSSVYLERDIKCDEKKRDDVAGGLGSLIAVLIFGSIVFVIVHFIIKFW